MQIRALMYFDELVRTKSMRQAAENLNVAPTAISRQIENLEDYFGAPLVERNARGVTLTAAGELLAARAGRTFRELENVVQLIGDLKGLRSGKVVIFANGAVVASLLGPALAEFGKSFPAVRFEIRIGSADEATDAVKNAQADLALTLFTAPSRETTVVARTELSYEVIVPPGHSLQGASAITLRDLTHCPLALPEKSFSFRQAFDAAAARQDLAIEPAFTASSLEMLKELVLRNLAITLLPRLAVQREIDGGLLLAIPLSAESGITTHAELSIAPDRQLSFAAQKLIDFLRDHLQRAAEA